MSHRSIQQSAGEFLTLPAIVLFIASYPSIKPWRTSLPYEHVTNLILIRKERKGAGGTPKKKKIRTRKKKNMNLWNTLVVEKPFALPLA